MATTPREQVEKLAAYVEGLADAMQNRKLSEAADWLKKFAPKLCAGGFICSGGDNCTSSHK